ncbi:Wzy polymerase domain-containing protein [Acinetobacter pseudolwoffii]|uniref:PglL family O-oligosaccharyltransferase n=1 Tax=Acinetobacter pseudolwoffii TaxID=2053287 RepID=UPI003525C29F
MKKNNVYWGALLFLLASMAYLLPNYYDPWRTVYHDFAMYGVLLCLLVKLLLENNDILINKKVIFIFSLALIPLLQNLFGKIYFFGDALIASIYIFSFGLAVIIGLNLRRNYKLDQILKFISAICIFVGLVSSFIILKQWLLLTNGGIWTVDVPSGGRPFANFAQPNNAASFLLLSVLATLYLYEKKIIHHLTGIGLACLLLFCLALTQSRTVWIFIVCFLIWWLCKSSCFSARLGKYAIFYFAIIFVLSAITAPYLSDLIDITLVRDVVERATSGHHRILMWKQLLYAVSQEPIWGYGWNQVSVAQLSVFEDYPIGPWTEHSHNIILDLLIWNGVPIGILIIGFFALWLWKLSKLTTSIEVFIGLAMIGVLFVHGLLEYPLEYAFFLLPFGLILGMISFDLKDKDTIFFNKNIGIFIFTAGFILFTWIILEYRTIEKDMRLAQFELKKIGTLHAQHDTPNVVLLTQLREHIRFLRTQPEENMSQEQLDWMRKVTYRYADDINLYKYSQTLAINNQEKAAQFYLKTLNRMHQENINFESLYSVNDSLSYRWKQPKVSQP